jgi:hypothetical protein
MVPLLQTNAVVKTQWDQEHLGKVLIFIDRPVVRTSD